MTKILIVGASPAGLHLAHGLLTHGYDVTLINAGSSTEIRKAARPSLTQFELGSALAVEQGEGLAMWDHLAPRISGARLHLHPAGTAATTLESAFAAHGVSVDRRVKVADWLEYLEDRGAKVVIHGVAVNDLDFFSKMFDLVVLATGYGELGALFESQSSSAQVPPRRVVAQAIIEQVGPGPHRDTHIVAPPPGSPPGYAPEPVVGEHAEVSSSPELRAILSPVLCDVGPQYVLQLVGAPDGPMDNWPDRPDPEEIWRRMRALTAEYAPLLHQRLENAILPAEKDASMHTYTPHVRTPVATLPSGGPVLGMAEAVVSTDDPVAAQAPNMAVASSQHYLARIRDHGPGPFSPEWMHETFEGLWQGEPNNQYPFAGMGRACLGLSQVLDQVWDPNAPDHLMEVLGASATHQQVADRFIGGLDDPRSYTWLHDAQSARAYLSELT